MLSLSEFLLFNALLLHEQRLCHNICISVKTDLRVDNKEVAALCHVHFL